MTADLLFDIERPTYSVPSLAEILTRDNGLTAVSTFSGCGGSSLGLHMAGWRIPYAVEFIPAARETYEANFPETYVDPRDIRKIDPGEILVRIGLGVGELDLFEGSPPCSSFSVANTGKTRYGTGKPKHYSEGVHQVTDDLFDEWVRMIEGIRPRAVLAENVPGLLGDNSTEYYRSILHRLKGLGYAVDADISNAGHYGAATSRRRLIIRGVRRDVGPLPKRPTRKPHGFTIGDALAALPREIPRDEVEHSDASRYAIGEAWGDIAPGETSERFSQVVRCSWDRPLPSITQRGQGGGTANPMHPDECRTFTPTELAWIFGYPADFIFTGTPAQRYERIARSVAPPLYAAHGAALADALQGARA